MPGPSEQSRTRTILDFFAGTRYEPFTAAEIASETDCSLQTVADELNALVDRGVVRTKDVDGGERVWWPPVREREDGERTTAIRTPTNATDDQQIGVGHQRLVDQHRQLAQFVTRLDITDDLNEILRLITEEARDLVGAHQSVTSRTINQDWEQAINAISLSEKYAEYREYDTKPDGSGIYSVVCERNEPMRMTQAELESHPAWNAFGDDADEHPPMRGWLAVPIVGREGENVGIIQLSDKYRGEFTKADEAILVQLANVAAAAIENARLYEELRESEQRYRTLFESMTEGYCVIEKVDADRGEVSDFRYVEANPAFEEYTDRRDVVGNTIRETVRGEPQKRLDVFESIVQTGEPVTFEYDLETRRRILQCRAFPIEDVSKGQVGMTVRDITERVEHERRLEESNNRLEQFAHAASHDLQEPLRMVSSYLQMIERRYADRLDEDGREFIEFAVDGADRMREMIEALLRYSRVDTRGNPIEPVELEAIVDDVLADLQVKIDEANAEISVGELPIVMGDSDQLRQVFQNLLDNAIEYSGDARPAVHVDAERAGDRWVVSVSDEGLGIDPDDQERIFEVFQSLHARNEYDGTGIGLALCERIVERHGGDIRVDSEPGDGSTFSFTLPAPGDR